MNSINPIHRKIAVAPTALLIAFTGQVWANELDFHAQVNRMIRYADAGEENASISNSDVQHLDNGANQTRFGFSWQTELDYDEASSFGGPDYVIGANWEVGITSNLSNDLGIDETGNDSFSDFQIRAAEIFITPGAIGTFTWGQGDGAARWAGRTDLSGTTNANSFDSRPAGGINFMDTGGFVVGDISHYFRGTELEGLRDDRLRYDTPNFAGFVGSYSYGQDRQYELGIQYHRESDHPMAFALGYTDFDVQPGSGNVDSQFVASGSVSFYDTYNLTAAFGSQDIDASGSNIDEYTTWYLKGGYQIGRMHFSVDFSQSDAPDPLVSTEEAEGSYYGVGVEKELGMYDLYSSYRNYEVERNVTGVPDPSDVDVFLVGGRLKF